MISDNKPNELSSPLKKNTVDDDGGSSQLMNAIKKETEAGIDPNMVGRPIWYIILSIYALLLTSTGFVTFFYNNNFSSRNEHIEQLDQIKTERELQIYEEMILAEVQNIKDVNNIANQAFNVVLGSLLGFLSATLTTLSSDENVDSSESINIQKGENP